MPPKVISPSRLARFYFHECERYLRFASVRKDHRAGENVPRPPYDARPVTQAILDSGYEWEEQVISELVTGLVHLGPDEPGRPLTERVIDQTEARRLLTGINAGESLYQAELSVPESFYNRFNLDRELVYWSPCRPDLIEAIDGDDGLVLRVIDIKASPGVKLSHRIQATVYSLILEALLEEWQVTDRAVAPDAGIWLAQQSEPDLFDLRMLRPPIGQFLEHELQPILRAPAEEAPWHLYFRCEWCEWFEHCSQEMRATDSVSRVPYLTSHAKRFLGKLDPPVGTIPEFAELLAQPERRGQLDDCASLRGRSSRLSVQVEALESGVVRSFSGSSLAMPRIENVRLVLTAQTEPVSGQVYAYGIYAQGIRDVLPDERPRSIARVAENGSPDTIDELERRLVRDLWEVLAAVDDYNQRHEEWRDRKSLQIYVFDTYEQALVEGALMRRLFDPEVSEQALKLLFHLQGEDLLQANEHPADEVFFPVVVLTNVLRDRLALPAEVTYRFADAVRLLQPENYGFVFRDNPYFAFELSNQMRSDAIYAVWYREETERIERIEKEIRARLWGANSLVNGLREKLDEAGALFAYPPKFALPTGFDYGAPVLSRLAFLAQYEAVLAYLDLRSRRMAALPERVRSGDAVILRHEDADRFSVVAIGEDLELDEGGFPNLLLAERNDDGERALLGFDDYFNRGRVWVTRRLPLSLAAITAVNGSPPQALHLALTLGPDTPELKSDQEYVLCERFTDFNTARVVEELRELDAEPYAAFLTLVERPHAFAAPAPIADEAAATTTAIAASHDMTPSQREALAGLLDRRLELVWGPPGTGKTHFLALAILALVEAHRASGEPIKVLISAFTHAAIENLMRKVDTLQRELQIVDGGVALGKLRGIVGNAGATATAVDADQGDAWLASRDQAILGGTVWSLRKLGPASADLVVLDEGSQVRLPEASIAVRRLADEGRLLIAGDDRQLPPIVNGAYPDPGEDEPLLHRSIFECLRRADPTEEYTTTLLENWRMNETLCRYPAEQVYVPDYRPANPAVAERAVQLDAAPSHTWVDGLLDPAFPLVVCVTEGVQASAENVVEARLVADTATRLRERLRDPETGAPFPDTDEGDSSFWRDGLSVVSPHHAQIRAIRRALDDCREWHGRPFVDTVDKMQGQECEAVIVSYGVSDVEYALSEQEFIYSLNRLNVAITRGRCNTISFLPRPLLEAPVAAFENDRVAEGIAFMQGLWRFAERGETSSRDLGDGARVEVHRVPAD